MFILEPKACGGIYSNKGLLQENLKENTYGSVIVYDGFQKETLNDIWNPFTKWGYNNRGYPWYIKNDSIYTMWAYKGDYQHKIFIIYSLNINILKGCDVDIWDSQILGRLI